EDLDGRRPAEAHALPLPKSVSPPDPVHRRVAGATEDRPADLLASHPDQDVRALPSGRSDGEDTGLGGGRVRRLYAELTIRSSPQRHVGRLRGVAAGIRS